MEPAAERWTDPARDAEDAQLIASREYGRLLGRYYEVVLDRLRLRLPDEEAREVRQRVFEHLLGELSRDKTYKVPFRVVVHQRTTWKLKEYFAEQQVRQASLPENPEDTEVYPLEQFEADFDLERRFAMLPERDRQVLTLRWRDGREIDEIARLLNLKPNAVHQALWRAHEKLRRIGG